MALLKKIVKANGVETTYHKVGSLSMRAGESGVYTLTTEVKSYVTKEIREVSEDNVADVNYYSLNTSLTELENNSIFAVAYNRLKALPEFEHAEDA